MFINRGIKQVFNLSFNLVQNSGEKENIYYILKDTKTKTIRKRMFTVCEKVLKN